jgi:hypothetical protein
MGCALALTLGGCQSEDPLGATGEVNVRVLTDNALINSRATSTPTQTMGLVVTDANNVTVKTISDVSTLTDNLVLPVGTYTFRAYSADSDNATPTWDENLAYYEGSKSITVADALQSVEIVCTLAQAKISVTYADELKALGDLSCVASNTYGKLTYSATETRAGFFPTSTPVTMALSFTNREGKAMKYESVVNLNARTHYHINYKVGNGSDGSFDVTFDPTTNDYTFMVPMSTKEDADNEDSDTPSMQAVTMNTPDVYGQVAYLYASSPNEDNSTVQFQYRERGTTTWLNAGTPVEITADSVFTKVNAKKSNGTLLCAKTGTLAFNTAYQYRVIAGSQAISNNKEFTTESYVEVHNLDFDTWSGRDNEDSGSRCPNSDGADSYWATGNFGTQYAGKGDATYDVTGEEARTGSAAKMVTLGSVTIAGYAAGSLFIGEFNMKITNPASSPTFGRTYAGARPLKLTGYYKYTGAAIDNPSAGTPADASFTEDMGDIYIRLWDANGNIIAENHFYPQGNVSSYEPFSIPLTYSSTAKAAKITIVCTSSRYGGVFNGMKVNGKVGVGSTLWVDDFSLSYDE